MRGSIFENGAIALSVDDEKFIVLQMRQVVGHIFGS
jgi:hypothetical protein